MIPDTTPEEVEVAQWLEHLITESGAPPQPITEPAAEGAERFPTDAVLLNNQAVFLEAAGDLYVAGHEGWYCVGCEAYYPEKDLEDGKCPTHGTAPEWQKEENVFFRLSRYQDRLLALYETGSVPGIPFVFPDTRLNEVRSFVAAGLKDLSVSRTAIEWGIPFPGHPGHVVYVWLDALTNYLTALGLGSGDETLPSKQVAHKKGLGVLKPVAAVPRKVRVTLEHGKIVVTPPTVTVRSGVSSVEWHGERDHEVKVKFVRESPFDLRNDTISGAPAKSKVTRLDAKPWPHVYKYKIQYRGMKLDPDVVVDAPP